MSDESTEKVTSCPSFDGNAENYLLWKRRFIAYCAENGCRSSLEVDPELPKKAGTYDTDATKAATEKSAEKRNKVAMVLLIMAMSTESLIELIEDAIAVNPDFPDGLASEVMKALDRKYIQEGHG